MKILDKYDKPSKEGTFAAGRKYDIHTGVDLYCEPGSPVYAIEDGVVSKVAPFTGPSADSPWWNDTEYAMVEGTSGKICYGEIESAVKEKQWILTGEIVGHVKTVLKTDKDKPMTMLHVELYEKEALEPVFWPLGLERPKFLLDVTDLLKRKDII